MELSRRMEFLGNQPWDVWIALVEMMQPEAVKPKWDRVKDGSRAGFVWGETPADPAATNWVSWARQGKESSSSGRAGCPKNTPLSQM